MKGEMIRSKKRRHLRIANKKRFYSFIALVTTGVILAVGGSKALSKTKPVYPIVEDIEEETEYTEIIDDTVQTEQVEAVVIEEPIKDVTVITTTDRVYIREFPNTTCNKLELLDVGQQLIVEGKYDKDWYIIKYNGNLAYINAGYVREHTVQMFTATREIVEKAGLKYEPEVFDYICELVATREVNLRKGPSTDTRVYTTINPGTRLEVIGQDGEWYIAKFMGRIVYVNTSFAKLSVGRKPKGNIKDVGYVTTQTVAFREPNCQIDSFYVADKEFVEIYGEVGDFYLVRTTDGVGYILKSTVKKIKKINNILVVVDISSNTMTAYKQKEDGTIEMFLEAPTITGKPGNDTPLGLTVVHRIYNYLEDGERHVLKGKDYEVPVDYCLKLLYIKDGKTIEAALNGESLNNPELADYGINIHTSSDAEDQYGGNKYKSHGCIRTTDRAAITLTQEAERGDLAYIKR